MAGLVSVLRRLFGQSGAQRETPGATIYEAGGKVDCQKCGRSVKIDVPRKDTTGKILVSSVDDMMPFAFRCRKCDYMTCAKCALLAYELHNPRKGITTCPCCSEVAVPFFTEWLAIKKKTGA